jgi:GAF domain-containing protein
MIDGPAENRPAPRDDERGAGAPPEPDPSDALGLLGAGGIPDPEVLVRLASAAVPNCDHVCLSTAPPGGEVHTLACSDAVAETLEAAQRETAQGPLYDVRQHGEPLHVADLEADPRWPDFTPRARATGTRTVLAVRLETEDGVTAALVFYADRPHAFEPVDFEIAAVFGLLVALAMQGARYREQAANLEIALQSNRQIGTAIGIIMARELLTAEQAFQRLRDASQRQHRKLRAIADDVVRTGELPEPGEAEIPSQHP